MIGKKYIAVLDLETTGLNSSGNDRIVEIGVVFLDSSLREVAAWSSLVNPKRDAGPRHIHGIASKWLLDAPVFKDLAIAISEALAECLLVAHNASFDIGFLRAEFKRQSIDFSPADADIFDTMTFAQWIVPTGASLKLGSLCQKYEISNTDEHSALGDARATAQLLVKMATSEPSILDSLNSRLEPHIEEGSIDPLISSVSKVRPEGDSEDWARGFIPALVSALPISSAQSPVSREYELLLHQAFEDFALTVEEFKSLTHVAYESGLSITQVGEIHDKFFQELTTHAWEDGILTDKEWEQLEYVGRSLGVSSIKIEMAKSGKGFGVQVADGGLPLGLQKGDVIVLTGEMVPSKSELTSLLSDAGLEVKGNISKKVRLVIAADPDSMSGKAAGARRLGIPLISVDLFTSQWHA